MTPGRYLSFDPVADDYDLTRVIPPPQMEEIVRLLARESHLSHGGLFLDAGVGTGRFAAPLARLHPGQIVGIDIAGSMMGRIAEKAGAGSLSLAQADLQRLPFQNAVFSGVLMVHILQLIEKWPLVLMEVRRVLAKDGTLFLGVEQGGRSVLVDFYYERARARRVLAANLGSPGLSPVLAWLRRRERDGGAGARAALIDTPYLTWKHTVPLASTLAALERRTYSQMWDIAETDHAALLAETRLYAQKMFQKHDAAETLPSRFVIYAVRW